MLFSGTLAAGFAHFLANSTKAVAIPVNQKQANSQHSHSNPGLMLAKLQPFGNRGITDFIVIETDNSDAQSVFYLAFTQIVQTRPPTRVLLQILCDMPGKK